jgi:hypothetical protein
MADVALLNQQQVFAVMPHLALARQRQQARLTRAQPQAVNVGRVLFHAAHCSQPQAGTGKASLTNIANQTGEISPQSLGF